MSIDSIPPINGTTQTETVKPEEKLTKPVSRNSIQAPNFDRDTKMALDHASGLLQSIVTDKLSEKVIRKLPSDEYLHLLSLLDDIISGSVDEHV